MQLLTTSLKQLEFTDTSSLEENNNSYKESLTNSINGLLASLVHWTSNDAVQSTKVNYVKTYPKSGIF